jgi:ElaB/YqjD/DUF883 family membrane-anchored ribosome-binding protein
LSTDDLAQFQGGVDALIGMIQWKTGEGRETVETFLAELTGTSATMLGQAAEAARHYAHQTTESLRKSARHAADQVCEGLSEAGCVVRDHPCRTLALCLGAGVLVGLALALRWRCKNSSG